MSVHDLFTKNSARLFGAHDFVVFRELANSMIIAGDEAAETNAGQLELLLSMTVSALAADPASREFAARAIDAYVADVWPVRRAAGLDAGGAARLAADAGVRNIVQPGTNFALRSSERPSASAPGRIAMRAPSAAAPAATTTATNTTSNEGPGNGQPLQASDRKIRRGGQAATPDLETDSTAAPPQSSGEEPAPPPTPPPPTPPPTPTPTPPRRKANDQQFGHRPITYDQVCEVLINKRDRGRFRAVVLGLATAGKTFFVQRLARSLGGNYTLLDYWGAAPVGGSKTDRTQGVVYYELRSNHKAWPSIDLFDVPGEAFRGLASGNRPDDIGGGVSPELPSLYAVMAATDLAIFIEPAFEVLAPDQYRNYGDDFEPHRREDFVQAIRSTTPAISDEDLAVQVEEALVRFRINHLNLAEHFHNNFEVMRARTAHLRDLVTDVVARKDLEGFKSHIADFIALDFAMLDPRHRALSIPGLYLLSKADEFEKRAGGNNPAFDRDPALTLAQFARDRFKVYSRGFELFGVDFITSEPRADEDATVREFVGEEGSAGFEGLITHWIRPAVRLTRPAKWWEVWKIGKRWARSPERALAIRRWVDPLFRRWWNQRLGA